MGKKKSAVPVVFFMPFKYTNSMPENDGNSLKNSMLGNVELDTPFTLAPISGYTIPPFRKKCLDLGAALAFTEMISCKGLLMGNPRSLRFLERIPGEKPLGAQIFGNEPKDFYEAARIVEKRGFDVCDINMACPVPKVTRSGAGAALLKDPERALAVVKATREAVGIPVTVKIRIGWDNDSIVAPMLAERFFREGIPAIFIHGRTREQGFKGEVRWDVIGECARIAGNRFLVFGSGDLFTTERCMEVLEKGCCHALQIARGALWNPWIFDELKSFHKGHQFIPPTGEERKEFMKEILSWLVERLGEYRGVHKFRAFFCKLTKNRANASLSRRLISRADTLEEAMRIIEST